MDQKEIPNNKSTSASNNDQTSNIPSTQSRLFIAPIITQSKIKKNSRSKNSIKCINLEIGVLSQQNPQDERIVHSAEPMQPKLTVLNKPISEKGDEKSPQGHIQTLILNTSSKPETIIKQQQIPPLSLFDSARGQGQVLLVEQRKMSEKKRAYKMIDYSIETRKKNIAVKMGNEQETASLNINFKTMSKGYLLEYAQRQNDERKKQVINEYINRDKANFKSTRRLFGVDQKLEYPSDVYEGIRNHMQEVYSSAGFMRKVMENEKMEFKNKLVFVKYMGKIRESAIQPQKHNYWKQRF